MKSILLVTVGIFVLSTSSAYAIDTKYRQKLERSGCTQISEMKGCDITKTKAENAKAGFVTDTPSEDVKVKNTPYHAVGQISCSMGDAAPGSAQCEFGVVRGEYGDANVYVTPPGGFQRLLTFNGEKVSVDDESKVKSVKSGDDWIIDVNDYEHYRIPSAVVSGG